MRGGVFHGSINSTTIFPKASRRAYSGVTPFGVRMFSEWYNPEYLSKRLGSNAVAGGWGHPPFDLPPPDPPARINFFNFFNYFIGFTAKT